MPWYAVLEDGAEVGRVFVLSDADLQDQLRDGQTAEEADHPFIAEYNK